MRSRLPVLRLWPPGLPLLMHRPKDLLHLLPLLKPLLKHLLKPLLKHQ